MAYRRTDSVEARLADNRNRILAAARTLVGEGGWPNAQVSHVAAAAGLATGTVYRYFPSKAHLCVEVLSTVSQREVDVMRAIADGAGRPAQRLHAAVTAFVQRAMRNRRLAYALIAEPCEPEIDQARLTYRHAISEQIVRIVRDGQAAGDFRACVDARIAATVIVGGFMEGLIGPLSPLNADFGAAGGQDSLAVQDLAGEIANLCCAGIGAPRGRVARLPSASSSSSLPSRHATRKAA
ncbi:TetR/AcrR family transcriptional regulator [Ramlibacter sp.]|uniref:TetR/AcrR family transcriptional regulator n=1 Tax=Ramlibacter sp. TaxID=1917967 RepID=UPI0017B3A62E|nr:TetR/AcrR family transcriptional regulator [Ramlibacter sp.]MBA2675883.1 TetR/AcrR family transcriptional regulator [Ramlibacter sp.]